MIRGVINAVMEASIEKSSYNDMSQITIESVLTDPYHNYEISLQCLPDLTNRLGPSQLQRFSEVTDQMEMAILSATPENTLLGLF